MLKVDKITVMNFENAIRGARNPMNSWARMDSYYDDEGNFVLGENDLMRQSAWSSSTADLRSEARRSAV